MKEERGVTWMYLGRGSFEVEGSDMVGQIWGMGKKYSVSVW